MVHLREEVTAPTAAGGDASPVRKTKSDVTMTCIDHLDFYVLIVLSAWELVRNREGHVIQFRNNRSRISCNDLLQGKSFSIVHVDSFEENNRSRS